MTTTATAPAPTSTNVGMAQIAYLTAGEVARTVLGSCIGLALFHPRKQTAAFAHIVLPTCGGRSGPPGKFADTALPAMLEQLALRGVSKIGLVAKLAGGANMFGGSGPIQIGEANHAAVLELLAAAGIPVVGEHVGGTSGRRVAFDGATRDFTVEIAAGSPVVI
ncbi:MAG: chemotaxis protein CheD [Planctomycetales bacterium]|nr:chemotaxis protein CheD [Planctomycetales bacterium]